MIVKICGITSYRDAVAAIEAGADILGFNFYTGSSRYILPEACERIQDKLSGCGLPVLSAGIFLGMDRGEIRTIRETCRLDLVQIYDHEPSDVIDSLGVDDFLAVRRPVYEEVIREIERHRNGSSGPRILLDRYEESHYGGTGEPGDWTIARRVAERYPVILAGGLTPENVRSAVSLVRPWGVDVATGVETSPGKKDPSKMHKFVQAAKGHL